MKWITTVINARASLFQEQLDIALYVHSFTIGRFYMKNNTYLPLIAPYTNIPHIAPYTYLPRKALHTYIYHL